MIIQLITYITTLVQLINNTDNHIYIQGIMYVSKEKNQHDNITKMATTRKTQLIEKSIKSNKIALNYSKQKSS